ncbi:hypothetical protein HK104_007814 [Borealophlyctis nickersoniae]|nr:hypothetical protein HK104_007814 [Borealophlyctis nickersoniae]
MTTMEPLNFLLSNGTEPPNCRDPSQTPHLEWYNVAIASSLIIVNGAVSLAFGLGLEATLVISTLRCVIQLTLMGYVLKPGHDVEGIAQNCRTFARAVLLILLAAIEVVFNKAKHRHQWMFMTVLTGMLGSTVVASYVGNAFAIQAHPWYQARTYIPTLGMLLGNSIGLNSAMTQLLERREHLELYFAFGASRWEAARPVCVEAIKLALLPTLNQMSIMGLISIPGMMTGQILGGAKIDDAVRYQIIIMFMITASCSIATVIAVLSAVWVMIDGKTRLRVDLVTKNKGGVGQWAWDGIKDTIKKRKEGRGEEEGRPLLNGR